MAKASPTMCNLSNHRLLPYRIKHNNKLVTLQQPSSGHGFVSFAATDPARVDVLAANYEEQEYKRPTRRRSQTQHIAQAEMKRQGNKRFPVLVAEVGALPRGLQRRPAQVPRAVGLQSGEASWKPLDKGTNFFAT